MVQEYRQSHLASCGCGCSNYMVYSEEIPKTPPLLVKFGVLVKQIIASRSRIMQLSVGAANNTRGANHGHQFRACGECQQP
jgi:hypothetical protein